MKYISKQHVIEAAHKAGSTAKTFKGAAKFMAKIKPEKLLENRGVKVSRSTSKSEYIFTKRGKLILNAINLMDYAETVALANTLTKSFMDNAVLAMRKLFDDGHYRRSHSSWAGGRHFINVLIGMEPKAEGYSTREWSDNGKWSGTNSTISITTTWRTLACFPNLTIPETHYIVIDVKPSDVGNVFEVTVLEQGRGFDVNPMVKWYVIGKGLFKSFRRASRNACDCSKLAA